jgi:hypothetical protein
LTYAVRIALVEEFGDGCPSTEIQNGNVQTDDPCLGLLESVQADPDETWWYVSSL